MKSKFWQKNQSIEFTVQGKPPRKSSWGAENDMILRLRQQALEARNKAGILGSMKGPVKLTLTVYAPNIFYMDYVQKGNDDPNMYVGDLDSFVAGVCESLQPAPKNFDRKISSVFEGHDDVGPDASIIVENDSQIVEINASKKENKKIYYKVKIEPVVL